MTQKRMYDFFMTHAWRYHDDWTRASELLDKVPGLSWRNFSLPWHDPAMNPNTPIGGKFIRDFLENQIIPVHGVVLLAGVYEIKSARRWVDLELEMARKHNKPIIGVPAIDATTVPDEVRALCDASVGWDMEELISCLDEIRGLPKYSGGQQLEPVGSSD